MTTKFCVVGSPIQHSLSPVLHQAAYQELGLDWTYEKHLVEQGQLANFIQSKDYAGLSVTMPLKREAFDFASEWDENSLLTNVSNTLALVGGSWQAANTDVFGIEKALSLVDSPKSTVILGSGATSASALVAVSKKFPKTNVHVMARNQESAADLVALANSLGLSASKTPISAAGIAESSLVLSLVPAGSFDEVWDDVSRMVKGGWLFDVSYSPWPSVAAMSWESERTISGLEMLIWQAISQIEFFAHSQGISIEGVEKQLYQVMKSAVSAA